MALQMTVSQNQIPQTTVIRILQMIQIPQIVTTVLIRIINSGNGTGDSSDDPGNGGNSDDPGTNDDPGSNDDPGNGGDMISTAEQYIGQSLDALEGACGSPQGSSYEDDPETGKTGFHYYSNFTVSTTV